MSDSRVQVPQSAGRQPTVYELGFKGAPASWRYPMSLRREDGLSMVMKGRDEKYYAYKRDYVFEVILTDKDTDSRIPKVKVPWR